jgi:hypothetical protein
VTGVGWIIVRNSPDRPSATSLPASPHDDAQSRSVRYLLLMGVRILCFILMVVITPYGWYTWVLAAAAVFLPYFAVVLANVGETARRAPDVPQPTAPMIAAPGPEPSPRVIRIEEHRQLDDGGPT